jgi:hypothetical protein
MMDGGWDPSGESDNSKLEQVTKQVKQCMDHTVYIDYTWSRLPDYTLIPLTDYTSSALTDCTWSC